MVVEESVTVVEVSAVPVLEVYHFHAAPVPRAPADTLRVVELPEQMVSGVAAAVGLVDMVLTVSLAPVLEAVLPAALVTEQVYVPVSLIFTVSIVNVSFVAPL